MNYYILYLLLAVNWTGIWAMEMAPITFITKNRDTFTVCPKIVQKSPILAKAHSLHLFRNPHNFQQLPVPLQSEQLQNARLVNECLEYKKQREIGAEKNLHQLLNLLETSFYLKTKKVSVMLIARIADPSLRAQLLQERALFRGKDPVIMNLIAQKIVSPEAKEHWRKAATQKTNSNAERLALNMQLDELMCPVKAITLQDAYEGKIIPVAQAQALPKILREVVITQSSPSLFQKMHARWNAFAPSVKFSLTAGSFAGIAALAYGVYTYLNR